MISVAEAKKLLIQNIALLNKTEVSLKDSLGCVITEDIHSPLNLPDFRQSAMDGYAVSFEPGMKEFELVGSIQAGDEGNVEVALGQAVRIFTGAVVPDGANAVVMQEKVEDNGQTILIDEDIRLEQHIRQVGDQISEGDLAIEKGSVINAATVGFLATIGKDRVEVYRKPSIALTSTGNELVSPGQVLKKGQVYESNSYTLEAALNSKGFEVNEKVVLQDTFEETKEALATAFEHNDVLIVSGGISVGEYDFVGKALLELGVEQIFYKIKQKPGKPIFFGKLNGKYVFALPGNPAASLTCYYEYVLPALNKMIGIEDCFLKSTQLPLLNDVKVKLGRDVFLKAVIHNEGVEVLDGQYSFIIKSFSEANALIYLPVDKELYQQGEEVEVHLL